MSCKKEIQLQPTFSLLVSCNDDNEKNNNEQKANRKTDKKQLTFFLSKVNQDKK